LLWFLAAAIPRDAGPVHHRERVFDPLLERARPTGHDPTRGGFPLSRFSTE